MNKKKLLALLLALGLILSLAAGCASTPAPADSTPESSAAESVPAESAPVLTTAVIAGPTGIGAVGLMAQNDAKTSVNQYSFTLCTSPQEAASKLTNGDVLFASVPTNLAASLYAKTSGKVRMLAINTGSVLSLLENGDTIHSVADLKGKTIYSTGQGANPEYLLRYLLTKNGLDPDKDVKLEFLTENTELATLLVSNKAQVALVPQPVATMVQIKNTALRKALDVGEEWAKIAPDSQPLMGCVIALADTVEKYPQTVAAFLKEYKASVEAATADVEKTAGYCETYGIIEKAALAKAAIPQCALTYIDGADMKKAIGGYFDMLFAADPKSVGGAVPGDDFYYVAE